MSPSKRVSMYNFGTFFILSLVIIFCNGEPSAKNDSCGFLYKDGNFTGDAFSIGDGSNFPDLEEAYFTSDQLWNVTNSFKVSSGCLFTACNETYFDGKCLEFTEDSVELPTGFDSLLSANCTCAADCRCTDVRMRGSSCARAYISKGCNSCNAFYTDLKGSKSFVPEDFKQKIASIIVRKGCSLTVYGEEDFQGAQTLLEGIIKEAWSGNVESYECVCDEAAILANKQERVSQVPEGLQFIDIPYSVDNISALLDTELGNIPKIGKHPGLVAALKSVKAKRSPRNAYILLIGLTGAGKSSAINLLFDNPNVTKVGGASSTTSDIHEFRIPVPIEHLGIRNSELRVIDTPGLGDTRGLEQDAKFLATLEDYLSGHEELSKRIPNVVLVFAKFHDNRFSGDGATFVKMLRGLQSFRDRITDKKFSNIIFVFSHFMSETKAIRKRPGARLQSFKKVIEDYSLFPKPISIVVAENKAAEQELPILNGYYKLPNGDYYPRNLFEKIEFLTINGVDPIGEAVIRAAFSNSDDFNITSSTHHLVSSQHSNVLKYLNSLSNAVFNPENTEVSQILQTAFETLDMSLRKKFPDALPYLQRAFNIHNIVQRADVPKTTFEIVKFLKDIKQNEAVLYLMEKAFALKPPMFKENIIAGYGYNVIEDRPLLTSPFKMGDLKITDMGYMIPNVITCNVEATSTGIFRFFESRTDYLQSRLQSLKVEGTVPVDSFKGELQPGSNIINFESGNNRTEISAVKEHRTFELVLNDRLDLTPQFINTVKSLTPYNETDYEGTEAWLKFFKEYGTHVVKSTYGGGSIEIKLASNKTFGPEFAQAMFNIIEFAEDVTIGKVKNTTFDEEGTEHHLKFRGGDQKYHTSDLKSMSLTEAADILENWKESLTLNPTILITDMRLLPISEVARKIGQNYSSAIQNAAVILFNSTLIYVSPPKHGSIVPEDRFKTGMQHSANQQSQSDMALVMRELMEASRRSDERMQEIMKEMRESNDKHMERFENQAREERKLQEERSKALAIERADERKIELERLEEAQRRFDATLVNQKDEAETAVATQIEMNIRMQAIKDENAARVLALEKQIAYNNGRNSGSCLKKGTKILMANGLELAVEDLKIGDVVLDEHLIPTSIMGVSSEFILEQNFYGFEINNYFFTNGHLLVGRNDVNGEEEIQLYAMSTEQLYEQNPLMEYLRVDDMRGEFSILKYNNITKLVQLEKVTALKDPARYPRDTEVYFIQVDNPQGTYIANRFVCRHELPPVEYWPKTIALIYSIVYYPETMKIAQLKYSLESLQVMDEIIDEIYYKMEGILKNINYVLEDENDEEMLLENFDTDKIIGEIFGNPSFSAFTVGLYGRAGNALADRLDLDLEYNGKVGTLQKLLWEASVEVIRHRINSYEFKALEKI